jgi:hypothetical protein
MCLVLAEVLMVGEPWPEGNVLPVTQPLDKSRAGTLNVIDDAAIKLWLLSFSAFSSPRKALKTPVT